MDFQYRQGGKGELSQCGHFANKG